MAVTLNKANLVLKDANGNIGKIEQLSDRDLDKIRTAVSDVALVVNQSNHTPIEATTTNKGVVQLATSADVVAGASDKVVTAEQLHNSTTGTSALATENLARIDAVVTEAGIPIDHTNTNQLKAAVTTLISNAAPATATSDTVGVVKPDNDTITIDSNGVLTATAQMPGVATNTTVGVVKPDGNTITVDSNGTLTATAQMPGVATTSSVGVVKPDNDTITVGADGTLTATAQMPGVATNTTVGVVKPDGTTITVDGDGTLTCGGKNLVRSVNSITPDASGNVLLGTEKSTFNKVVYGTGYFSITTSKGYSFDLTGSDLENVSKENVNIRLIAKVTTAHNGFEVGDIAQVTTTLDSNAQFGELDICSYIRGNTLYVYSGQSNAFSIHNGTGWLNKQDVQIKAILTAFIPDDGSILLIAEDQTNTSKLIGLPDGTLTWKDKNLVTSVNDNKADNEGNVNVPRFADWSSGVDITSSVLSMDSTNGYTFPYDCVFKPHLNTSDYSYAIAIALKPNIPLVINGTFIYLAGHNIGVESTYYFKKGQKIYRSTSIDVGPTGLSKFTIYPLIY